VVKYKSADMYVRRFIMLMFVAVKASKIVSERKAVVTVASVVVAFAVCWVPYFTVFIIKPFLSTPIDHRIDQLTLWLGYANSSVNPFLYAFYNSSFRDGFRGVLCRPCPCCRSGQPDLDRTFSSRRRSERGSRWESGVIV